MSIGTSCFKKTTKKRMLFIHSHGTNSKLQHCTFGMRLGLWNNHSYYDKRQLSECEGN